MIHPSSDPSFAATNARTTDESVATASSYPPATAATRAPAASPRYPPRRCGPLHSACSGSRWTTYLAGPLPLGCALREPRGTLLWWLPGRLVLSKMVVVHDGHLSSVSGTFGGHFSLRAE